MIPLHELYQQNELHYNYPDIPRAHLIDTRLGYSSWGAIAMSLEEWDKRGELVIDDRTLRHLNISFPEEGDEITIEDVHLLALERSIATRSWIFLDADQPENHRRFMWRLKLQSELDFKFALIWMMQDEVNTLFPDMAGVGGLL